MTIPSTIETGFPSHPKSDYLWIRSVTVNASTSYPVSGRTRLSLLPERYFGRLADQLEAAQIPDEDLLTFQQIFYPMATRVAMDRHGRVVLPEEILHSAGIGREVSLVGSRDRLDIWNKKDYDDFLAQEWPRYDEIQKKARLAMRRERHDEQAGRS